MSLRPSWILAAVAAGVLIYQVSTGIDSEPASEPGITPSASTTELPDAPEDLSAARRPDEDSEPRADIQATVTGVIHDHLGSPRAGERIWILRPGERHPEVFGHAKKLRTIESDAQGEFQFELGPEDEWHFSVGAIGKSEVTTPVRRFENGEQARVEIVLAGTAHLRVHVQSAGGIDSSVQPARIEILRKTQEGDNRKIPFGAPPKPGFGLDPDAKPEAPEPWATSFALGLELEQDVLFPRLKVGDTYRVAVVLGDRTAIATAPIVLKSGGDRVARCVLSVDAGELTLAMELEETPESKSSEPGFHWQP